MACSLTVTTEWAKKLFLESFQEFKQPTTIYALSIQCLCFITLMASPVKNTWSYRKILVQMILNKWICAIKNMEMNLFERTPNVEKATSDKKKFTKQIKLRVFCSLWCPDDHIIKWKQAPWCSDSPTYIRLISRSTGVTQQGNRCEIKNELISPTCASVFHKDLCE